MFDGVVYFDRAIFQGTIFFIDVQFVEEVSFKGTKFNEIFLSESNFIKSVDFSCAEFKERFRVNIDFGDNVLFEDTIFHNEVEFDKVNFEKIANFRSAKFSEKVSFTETIFSKKTIFSNATFSKSIHFFENEFKKPVEFDGTNFLSSVHFNRPTFNEKVSFKKSIFKEKTLFERPIFEQEVAFSFIDFKNVTFLEVNKYWDQREYNYTKPPNLYFQNVFFRENIVFQNINLSKLRLENCDVSNITFSRCEWNDKKNRLTLKQDIPKTFLDNESKIKKLLDSENHYRQLKRNFDNGKNWELSGKAYVSEMEMRKKRLLIKDKYYLWFVYWYYGFFGGYTQDIIKPIKYLVISMLFFALIYSFVNCDYSFTESLNLGNLLKSAHKSIDAAIPFLPPTSEYKFWWLQYFQKLFCGTLVAFFILALRKRFKQ